MKKGTGRYNFCALSCYLSEYSNIIIHPQTRTLPSLCFTVGHRFFISIFVLDLLYNHNSSIWTKCGKFTLTTKWYWLLEALVDLSTCVPANPIRFFVFVLLTKGFSSSYATIWWARFSDNSTNCCRHNFYSTISFDHVSQFRNISVLVSWSFLRQYTYDKFSSFQDGRYVFDLRKILFRHICLLCTERNRV